MKNEKIMRIIEKYNILIILILCIIASLILGSFQESEINQFGNMITFAGLMILFLTFIIFEKKKLINKNNLKIFIIALLFFVYLGYILNTDCATRQHDTRSLNWENGGHLGYIEYILENHSLPNFNPTDKWCFTNPPLFYITSTLFVEFQNLIGRHEYQAIENLQFLTMFFVLIFDIYVFKTFKILKFQKSKEYILLFVGLSPSIVYLSGSLNNDSLAIVLCTMAIYYAIKWYMEDKLSDLIKIAFTIAFAIMTKINSAIIAIPIGILLLIKLVNCREKAKKIILYYCIFALISLPIGLWFPIKNLVQYNVPITYVQEVIEKEENDGYIGEHNSLERFFKIESKYLKNINITIEKGKSDYNIFLTTLKSFLVDEKVDYEEDIVVEILLFILFIICIFLTCIFIYSLFKNKTTIINLFFYLIILFELVFYTKFCFDYPYVFTMNFRYIVPIIIPFGIGLLELMENNEKMRKILENTITLYCIASVIIFLSIQ